MRNNYIQNGAAMVGGQQVPFRHVVLQERFRMYVPDSFQEDSSLSYRYSCLSNRNKSPLGVAIRFAPEHARVSKEKMVANFFGGDVPKRLEESERPIYYRESLSAVSAPGIYLMRFAVEAEEGVLLGCFNCSGDYVEQWKPAILAMLDSIEEVKAA